MYYHPERKLVYLAHPHTASRSTVQALLPKGFQKKKGENHHATLYESGIVTPENRHEWLVFTTVRNHFDWVLAQVWKVELAGHPNPDIDWSDLKMWERNLARCNWISDTELFCLHKRDADSWFRFENLWKELREVVPRTRKWEVGKNPYRRKRPYWQFYTPRVRDWVEDRFGEEMRELGYAF